MAAMTGQRAGNTLVGQVGLCGASHWLPVKTQADLFQLAVTVPLQTHIGTHDTYCIHTIMHSTSGFLTKSVNIQRRLDFETERSCFSTF